MKTIIAIILASVAVSFADPTTNAPSVTLAWDQSPDPSVAAYRIYSGISPRLYTNSITVIGRTNVSLTIQNLVRGTRYYFAATCVDTNSLESDFSAEVNYRTLTLPSPPSNLRVTVFNP